MGNKTAGRGDAVACLCDLCTEQPGSVACQEFSTEWERQHHSKLLSSAMLPVPKGEKFAWVSFCFFKNPYLQTSDLHTRITPRIILKVL